MAGLTIQLVGVERLQRVLSAMSTPRSTAAISAALMEAAMLTARIAATEKIIRGGRVGTGKSIRSAPPDPHRLTSRSGRLRASLAGRGYRQGIDASGLPHFIEVGSDVIYAAVHEFGGTVSQNVGDSTRSSAFGRPTKPYRVRGFHRTLRYPARPFLGPALRDASLQFERIFAFHYGRLADEAAR